MARLNYSPAGGGTWGNIKKSHYPTLGLAGKGLGKQDLPHQPHILGQKPLGASSEQVSMNKEIPKRSKAKWAKQHSGGLSEVSRSFGPYPTWSWY